MIESGSHTASVSAADFGLPPQTALRYEQPAPALRPLFPAYVVVDSVASDPPIPGEWQLPTWAQIWVVLAEGAVSVRIGNRHYSRLGDAVLCGVTSHAMPIGAQGGVSIVIEVSPLGWARLFGPVAEALRDRITPLETLLPEAWVEELVEALNGSDRALDVKRVLDDVLMRHLPPPHPDEPMIARIMTLLADPDVSDLVIAAQGTGIDIRKLRRLAKQYFGFPPKMLLIRTRLVDVVASMLLGERTGTDPLPPFYHDASHFNRDGRRFLGMTPRRFVALPMPYMIATLRARRLVVGAAVPSLDPTAQ